jgi:hypothetical protein
VAGAVVGEGRRAGEVEGRAGAVWRVPKPGGQNPLPGGPDSGNRRGDVNGGRESRDSRVAGRRSGLSAGLGGGCETGRSCRGLEGK